ncbi:MAG: dienelactone hydrolase family protein [Hyphomonadaceae bacterium]
MYRREIVRVDGSEMPVLLFDPEAPGPHAGLIVAQHLPVAHAGLERDPFQIEVGRRYAAAGYAVAMPWIFHWWDADAPMDVKRAEFRDDRTVLDLEATRALLARQAHVDSTRVGILGHCWGGRVAWLGAARLPGLKACAVFYGGRIRAPFADGGAAPITLAQDIACPVLGVFGNEDQGPSPADVDAYEAALTAAGVPYAFHRYDGAGHGFQDFNNPERYREAQSEDAWRKALAFFAEALKAQR